MNIGIKVATLNIVFSTVKNPALYECKVLQYTTLSMKIHICTLSELKAQPYTLSNILACLERLRGPETTLKQDFLTKSDSNTLQTCLNIAIEYLLA